MRILLKIILFPISLVLTIFVAVCRFVSGFSGALLAVISFILFVLAVLTLILLKDIKGAITAAVFSFLISPYGVPMFAEWLIDRLDDLNYAIKSI